MSLISASQLNRIKLTARIDTEEKRISAGVNNGSITRLEANVLRAEVAKAKAQLTAALKDGFISNGENKELNAQLAALSTKVTEMSNDGEKKVTTFTPELKLAAMSQRIEAGVKSGALTKAEAKALKTELAGVRSQLQSARKNGELTSSELDAVTKRLGELGAQVTKNVKNAEKVVKTIGPEIRLTVAAGRLGAAVATGRISEADAKKLQARFEGVLAQLKNVRSNGELTSSELAQINTELSALEAALKGSIAKPFPALLKRLANVTY
ncbi:MAG: hypothetical protein JNG84_07255 [Archangium sp.]|nr:hypothetical protein [Archangium sp.]